MNLKTSEAKIAALEKEHLYRVVLLGTYVRHAGVYPISTPVTEYFAITFDTYHQFSPSPWTASLTDRVADSYGAHCS